MLIVLRKKKLRQHSFFRLNLIQSREIPSVIEKNRRKYGIKLSALDRDARKSIQNAYTTQSIDFKF